MSFNSFNELLDSIVELLEQKLSTDIAVQRHFPPKVKPLPLNKITVAIGTSKRTASSKCIGDALTSSYNGKELSAQIEVSIYVPLSINSKSAYTVLDEILSILFSNGQFGITQAEHGVLSANRTTDSFELHCNLTSTLYETEE